MDLWQKLSLSFISIIKFPYLLSISLRQPKKRLSSYYKTTDGGTYIIFRETFNKKTSRDDPQVFVVHFRLKLLGRNKTLHWMLRRISLLSYPIWSGFPGLRTKLWTYNQKLFDYIGIYEWSGRTNLKTYINYLMPIVKFVSIRKSVWYKVYPGETINKFIKQ